MTVIEDLKLAKAMIEERGWLQGHLTDGQKICAVGALNLACCGFVNPLSWVTDYARRNEAYIAMKRHVPEEFTEIAAFNDHPTTTQQDVLNLFDKTLADLGGLA